MTTKQAIKRVTLTSKKNWWMVELDGEQEDLSRSTNSFSSSEETAVSHNDYRSPVATHKQPYFDEQPPSPEPPRYPLRREWGRPSPRPTSPSIFQPPRHPTAIFNFPTPSSYSAPPLPMTHLSPFATGSASELFRCVVKKPCVIQLEVNGETQSNASDVTTQFLAELRVYTTVKRHRNIAAFLGCLENVGMVLEYIEGRTLYDVISARPPLTTEKKIDYHNQLLDGLTHLHSFGLNHGDISLLNIQVTNSYDTIKLLDFGRSVSADSEYTSPDELIDPFACMTRTQSQKHVLPKLTRTVEQIHPGTRPFAAPEILRQECQDARLADAYSFGMVLVCLDRCECVDVKPWDQRKDLLPKDFLDGCDVFGDRAREYLRRWDSRRRLVKEDMMALPT